jgi:hypothetical protein
MQKTLMPHSSSLQPKAMCNPAISFPNPNTTIVCLLIRIFNLSLSFLGQCLLMTLCYRRRNRHRSSRLVSIHGFTYC